jgi:SAM-dependent methyltransferase
MNSSPLVAKNREFYNAFWSKTYLTQPERFNTWPLISDLLPASPQRLEIGPGLRPRLPIAGTHFVDLSAPVVERLNSSGGIAQTSEISDLPFKDVTFDLVTAFDVVEHVENDLQVFAELTRVLKPGGRLIFSVPLHPGNWSKFDDYVGHARRYEPAALRKLLAIHGLAVEKSAVFGMQSNNSFLLRLTVLAFTRHYSMTVGLYNRVFFPLGMIFQKPLKWAIGMMDLTGVAEVLVVCRKAPPDRE